MIPTPTTPDELLRRARCEFLEMPGLRLTERQAGRLWGLDQVSCATVLATLVDARFLFRGRDGAFMRTDGCDAAATTGTPAGRRPSLRPLSSI